MKTMQENVKRAIASMPVEVEKKCEDCAEPFKVMSGFWENYSRLCPACQDKKTQAEHFDAEEHRRQVRIERWGRICPPAYQHCLRDKLPDGKRLDDAMAWKFGSRGLVMHGDTGKGKTRCAWAILKREHFDKKSIAALDSMAGLKYASKYTEGANLVEEWIEELIAVDLLLLDDVFKNKLTDSFEGVIFTLVDQRIANCRPTILTSNDTGATLASRMTQDRGNPLLRRLRECCDQIHF